MKKKVHNNLKQKVLTDIGVVGFAFSVQIFAA